jgi:proteasome lid subunit RPN8/RPN11
VRSVWLHRAIGLWDRFWQRSRIQTAPPLITSGQKPELQPIQRLLITDEVSRTLFQEYSEHRSSQRGHEETGWLLLGLRREAECVALATLPAGALRDAGEGHILFNLDAQAVGSRIVRQRERSLVILGVVHTHPGSLRHPSQSDFRGDIKWIESLRGQEGIFGIGTHDPKAKPSELADHPKSHVQTFGAFRFDWYKLASGERNYQTLPVEITIGPELASSLRSIWRIIETNAPRLERLARFQPKLKFDPQPDRLLIRLPALESTKQVVASLTETGCQWFLEHDGNILGVNLDQSIPVDQGIFQIWSELARSDPE